MRQQDGQKSQSADAGMEWGKGLVQKREQEEQRKREEAEKHKPLARYKDDVEMNQVCVHTLYT